MHLFNPIYVVIFTCFHCRQIAFGLAEDAVSNALKFTFDSKLCKELFAFRKFKLFSGAVDPAAADSVSMSCQHQIAHHQTAVI